jgi:abortive infection bacteriophage resistance protein
MYNIVFKNRSRTPKASAYQLQKQLFDEIMVAKFIYPNKTKWNSFYFTAIKNAIDTYNPYIDLSKIGFPNNWEDVLINK